MKSVVHNGAKALRIGLAVMVMLSLSAAAVLLVPAQSANALYLISDGQTTMALDETALSAMQEGQVLMTGAYQSASDVVLAAGRNVTIRRGGNTQYGVTRANETVSGLLRRLRVTADETEIIRVDLSGEDVAVEIASDFTIYTTVQESCPYTTLYTTSYDLMKGETAVVQAGQTGTRDVTYEVVYRDGAFYSQEAVAWGESDEIPEIVTVGTRVKEAAAGDTIAQVITLDDGSGYLLMNSGDTLHFTRTMNIKCTAYTTGYDGVGTITYTGTRVHVGCVAVDKSVIALGSTMFIASPTGNFTYGMAHAEDTGVYGAKVDLYMNSYNECMQFGVRSGVAYFLD